MYQELGDNPCLQLYFVSAYCPVQGEIVLSRTTLVSLLARTGFPPLLVIFFSFHLLESWTSLAFSLAAPFPFEFSQQEWKLRSWQSAKLLAGRQHYQQVGGRWQEQQDNNNNKKRRREEDNNNIISLFIIMMYYDVIVVVGNTKTGTIIAYTQPVVYGAQYNMLLCNSVL